MANATNNLLYAQPLANAEADEEQEAKAAQAKRMYCDDLLNNANKLLDNDKNKGLDNIFSKCSKKTIMLVFWVSILRMNLVMENYHCK